MIRTLLQKRLMEVETGVQLDELGFGDLIRLQDYTNNEDFFERLFVASNTDNIQIVVMYEGNDHFKVIAFLDEFLQDKKVFNVENSMFGDFVFKKRDEIEQYAESVFQKAEELFDIGEKLK